MTTGRERAIARCRLLRALADAPGTDGEGKAARNRLDALRRRFRITDAELAGDDTPEPTLVRAASRPTGPRSTADPMAMNLWWRAGLRPGPDGTWRRPR